MGKNTGFFEYSMDFLAIMERLLLYMSCIWGSYGYLWIFMGRWQAPSDDEAGEGDAGGEPGPVDGGAPGAGLGQAGPLPWLGLDWNDLRSTTSYHNVFQYFN